MEAEADEENDEVKKQDAAEQANFMEAIKGMKQNCIICMKQPRSSTSWHESLPIDILASYKEIFPVRVQIFPNGETLVFSNLFGHQTVMEHATRNFQMIGLDTAFKNHYPRYTQCFGMAVKFKHY